MGGYVRAGSALWKECPHGGWMAGAKKRVIAYIPEMVEPELMYKLFDLVVGNLDDLVKCFEYDGEKGISIKDDRTDWYR